MTIRPSSTRRRIVPSESTEAGHGGKATGCSSRPRPAAVTEPDRGRRRRQRAPQVGPPAARRARLARARVRTARELRPAVGGDVVGVRGLVDRPTRRSSRRRRSAASGTRTGTASSSPRTRMVRPRAASMRQGGDPLTRVPRTPRARATWKRRRHEPRPHADHAPAGHSLVELDARPIDRASRGDGALEIVGHPARSRRARRAPAAAIRRAAASELRDGLVGGTLAVPRRRRP